MSIDKIKAGDDLTQSLDIVSDNISKLKELFPEVLTEGKIDFRVLQDILGNEIEEDDEVYRFTWAGKSQARREAHKPSTGTLRPCKEESVDWDKTRNVYIEGDNLEVLKLLQKSYSGKVKMVYADPPYNTGRDILYKNDFSDNLGNYLKLTNQTDDIGNILITNTDSSGRYHSNWLTMMYSRIRLSKNLLTQDGVFCIAIDHYELQNLIKICDEIFGEENKLGIIAVVHKPEGRNQSKFFGESHEYMLFYSKSKPNCFFNKVALDEEKRDEFNEKDEKGTFKRKNFIRLSDGKYSLRENKPDFYYPIYVSKDLKTMSIDVIDDSHIVFPITQGGQERTWKTTIDTAKVRIDDGTLFPVLENGSISIYEKLREDQVIKTHWIHKKYHAYHFGTKVVDSLLDAKTFDFPKSLPLIIDTLKLILKDDDLVVDLFSGSGTTAHAVMEVNKENQSKIRYMVIQLPEPTEKSSEAFKSGYKNIADIGKERIRRASSKINEELKQSIFSSEIDLGFKVFKLDSSNIKGWDGQPENLENSLFESQDNIKSDRKEDDVLFEILLKYGLDLTLPIEEKIIEGKKVFNVGFGALFICLGNDLTSKVAEGIGQWKETLKPETCRVIFKDGGFTDVEKTNSVQTLKRFGIQEIKSI
jgi:adenine-specific DNA-methyltransferase